MEGLEITALDGTTMELFRNEVLTCEFGTPADGARPLPRIAAHVRAVTRRRIAAAGGCHDGENPLADDLEGSFTPGILNLAGRGFFSMDRRIRFSAAGAHLAWRARNGAKSVPFKTIRVLPDRSELVMLRESDGMRTRRRREAGDPHRRSRLHHQDHRVKPPATGRKPGKLRAVPHPPRSSTRLSKNFSA